MWIALGCLLGFVALNAFGGGYYALAGAEGVPLEWLAGTPFDDYTVPGWILLVGVGGSCLIGSIAIFARSSRAWLFAMAAALILATWITIQVAIIGYVSWMQPAMAVVAGVIAVLAWRDRNRQPRNRSIRRVLFVHEAKRPLAT